MALLVVRGQRMVNGRLEAADVFNWLGIHITRARLKVLVEGGKDLRVKHLEATNPVYQPFQGDTLDHFVLVVNSLDAQDMVTEV